MKRKYTKRYSSEELGTIINEALNECEKEISGEVEALKNINESYRKEFKFLRDTITEQRSLIRQMAKFIGGTI